MVDQSGDGGTGQSLDPLLREVDPLSGSTEFHNGLHAGVKRQESKMIPR